MSRYVNSSDGGCRTPCNEIHDLRSTLYLQCLISAIHRRLLLGHRVFLLISSAANRIRAMRHQRISKILSTYGSLKRESLNIVYCVRLPRLSHGCAKAQLSEIPNYQINQLYCTLTMPNHATQDVSIWTSQETSTREKSLSVRKLPSQKTHWPRTQQARIKLTAREDMPPHHILPKQANMSP